MTGTRRRDPFKCIENVPSQFVLSMFLCLNLFPSVFARTSAHVSELLVCFSLSWRVWVCVALSWIVSVRLSLAEFVSFCLSSSALSHCVSVGLGLFQAVPVCSQLVLIRLSLSRTFPGYSVCLCFCLAQWLRLSPLRNC